MLYEEYRIIEGYLNLLKAIRNRADSDGLIDDFNDYWFGSSKMIEVWKSIRSEVGWFVLEDSI
jgi:hypothetical protein